jgi:hypothetical protein
MEGNGNVKLQMPNRNDDPPQLKLKDVVGINFLWKTKDMQKVMGVFIAPCFQQTLISCYFHNWIMHILCSLHQKLLISYATTCTCGWTLSFGCKKISSLTSKCILAF